MQLDRAKFEALIHYICHTCEPVKLGAVKLHKVLYFSDMLHYARTGSSITGETYRKQKFGPIASHLWSALHELEREGLIEQRDTDYYGYRKSEFISRASPRSDALSNSEIDLANEVIDFVCGQTAKQISDFTHNQIWESANLGEELPYFTVFQMFPNEISEEDIAWARNEAQKIASQGSYTGKIQS